MTQHTKEEIVTQVAVYVSRVQELVNSQYNPAYPHMTPQKITVTYGKKYAKVVTEATFGSSVSVHTFVDLSNGDILKAASWQKPAAIPRGNVFNENSDVGRTVSQYGAVYLRG
jgi:hypothetical protein